MALTPGKQGFATDTCVPISRLAECIPETKGDVVASGLVAPIVGHVGDAFGAYPFHLHFDIARIDLGANPQDWPGVDEARVRRDYFEPKEFIMGHRPISRRPLVHLRVGLHDEEGGQWMKANGLKGVCLVLATVQDQPIQLDYQHLADAGITVLLRIGYGYADGPGSLPPPDKLAAFENAVVFTLKNSRGVAVTQYGNEVNNRSEHPGWVQHTGPGPGYFEITPDYYIASYNRVWYRLPKECRMGPAALDPYFGPGSDSGVWWDTVLANIGGADALFLHIKTQTNNPDEVFSMEKFGDAPLQWQFRHFRAMETMISRAPLKYRNLSVYISEPTRR
jgi:hypothetical protein